MSAVNFNNQELALMNQSFIVPKYINAPFTTIQNRSQVLDASNMLQAVMGVERIPFKGINLLQKEFGANGEQVWELESKDARVRFVGGWYAYNDSTGNGIRTSSVNDFIEVSFYGNGLNLLMRADSTLVGATLVIDNETETTFNIPAMSQILDGRNYNPNVVFNLVSGRSLGQHTIRYKFVSNLFGFSGLEILNQSSVITIPAGQAFVGNKKESLAVLSTSAYNAGISGTKGGRVAKHLLNGAISQVVRECPASPSYLTNTDHTNEEVVRRINFREFGANRADDFSTLTSSSSRAFTLDDGTTTLVGLNVAAAGTFEGVNLNTNSTSFITLTFVGTGLDVIRIEDAANAETGQYPVTIDGVAQGFLSSPGVTTPRVYKICSGLPYGTHTVKINRLTPIGFTPRFSDFIIYQPKAPTLPVGAIQIADYCVLADYVAASSAAVGFVGQGVVRKMAIRENSYVGTWLGPNIDASLMESFFDVYTSTTASYMEYTWVGSGIVYTGYVPSAVANYTVLIDGVALNAGSNIGCTVGLVQTASGLTFSSAGVFGGTAVAGKFRASITGLPLAKHTIRITTNSTVQMLIDCFDVITPIHINHPTLKIGSLSLMDNSKIQALALPVSGPDLSKAKSWLVYDGANSKILASYNVSQVLNISTGQWIIYFQKPFKSKFFSVSGSVMNTSRFFSSEAINSNTLVSRGSGGSVSISTQTDTSAYISDSPWAMSCFGELIDE